MAVECTLSIIKPDAMVRCVMVGIHSRVGNDGFKCADESAVHGPDGPDTAKAEIGFFFAGTGICPRTR